MDFSQTKKHESPDSDHKEIVLRRVGRRINRAVFLSQATAPVTVVIVIFGLALLFTRIFMPPLSIYTYGILALLPVVLGYAWFQCRKQKLFFSRQDVVNLTDSISFSDGLAVTSYERPTLIGGPSVWNRIETRLDFHPLRLKPGWFAWRLLPALLFAGAAFLVPPRKIQAKPNPLAIKNITQPLADKLEITAELLPEPERKKLQQQLTQVQDSSEEGISREKWEAMEEVETRLENALARSQASTYQLSSSMNQLSALVSQQNINPPNQKDNDLQSQISNMASAIINQLEKQNLPISDDLKKALLKAMGQCKAGKPNSLELGKLAKKCESLLKKISQKTTQNSSHYGNGGVNRGRGDAPMEFGEQRYLQNVEFDPTQLENHYFNQKDLTEIGVTPVEPEPNPGMFKPGTVKNYGTQQGTSINRTQISPSQRGVVSRYFK